MLDPGQEGDDGNATRADVDSQFIEIMYDPRGDGRMPTSAA